MSGSSLDGLDVCCVTYTKRETKWDYTVQRAETFDYPSNIRDMLSNAHQMDAFNVISAHVEYGHFIGRSVSMFIGCSHVDFVAFHGHTVFHQPDRGVTFQLGEGETIASHLNCPLVCNFRNKDVAFGGQGAPLVPLVDRELFPFDVCLNLGGIANISYSDQGYDICACNQILNHFATKIDPKMMYDKDGAYAASGAVIPELLYNWNQLPFHQLPAPKSTGREWVSSEVIPLAEGKSFKNEDILMTACIYIAQQVKIAGEKSNLISKSKSISMLITGGGAHNGFLMKCIQHELEPMKITIATVSKEIIDMKEAICFAFLGLLCLRGDVNVDGANTGSQKPSVSGSIHWGGKMELKS